METLDLDRMLSVGEEPTAADRVPDVDGALPWRPSRDPVPAGPADARCTQREFANHLERAGVLDARAVELPGSAIMLPFGMRLMRRFEELVRRRYEEYGYEEHDYPLLVPTNVLDPTAELFPLDGRLLFAGDDADWVAGRKRAVLTPTGEAIVYTHWAKVVRSEHDLPIRMYRRAKYFRPAGPGQGLFRTIEAAGVYEFQACYPDLVASDAGMVDATRMARQVCADAHVPVLWSNRPPWTNNGAVAERQIGGDVPLPHGATVQVGCVYDQGDRFSRRYRVGWRDGARLRYTRHVTGCVTQRLVLAHLFLGLGPDGDLLVHPDLAPVQVAITSGGDSPDGHDAAHGLVGRLGELGVRAVHALATSKRETGRLHRTWRAQGVPLRVYLQAARFPGDPVRVVVVRADTREEATMPFVDVDRLARGLRAGVAQVAAGYVSRANGFVADRCTPATADTVRDVLTQRRVAVCPMEPTEESVRTVAGWRLGEVLGLNRADTARPCVITGRPTLGVAYVSPRT